MRSLVLMIQFFTRIPIRIDINAEEEDFSRGIVFMPLVGLIVGLFNYGLYSLARYLLGDTLAPVLWLTSNIFITGGIHLDGLGDTCDGLFSARDKKRMLEIMKDSRIGTNGVIAIVLDFIFRLSLLYSLPYRAIGLAIILAPVVAKTLVLLLMGISKYARANGGMGGLFYSHMSVKRLILGIGSGILMILGLGSIKGLMALLGSVIIILAFRKMVVDRIDGMTGDTLGAASELAEICFIIFIYILERNIF
ncbi:MAG: adenosylcobinamide-GDP ribazoletransferase [Lutispora sp.]|jgi:adenosylcobinamide-GDP ribazoletransferase|uniref:adenosylcobinamide-GDP ribazoletransferase n=1 Tax=Lutispora sp. TaxID=2828727 RepID=UPI0035642D60